MLWENWAQYDKLDIDLDVKCENKILCQDISEQTSEVFFLAFAKTGVSQKQVLSHSQGITQNFCFKANKQFKFEGKILNV